MNEHQKTAIQALENMRGDDLMRARRAFWNCSQEQMHELYGNSGKTRRQILDEYEARESRIDWAIAWVKGVTQ